MLNFLSRFSQNKIWDFKGGIHPPEMKTQSTGLPLRQIPLPERFILPLKQHIGHEGEILVKPGDRVLRGQPLTFGQGKMLPIHAPTSGVVSAIAPHRTAHPSALEEISIFIEADGQDRWIQRQQITDYRTLDKQSVINRIFSAGIAGLGGAGFPTATKLRSAGQNPTTLIINAAECEPYITADDRLMRDHAAEVITGSEILGWLLNAERILIGIEDNKPEAISALKLALPKTSTTLQLRVIPTKYPSGGAKQLTKILTGKEVPKGGRSSDIGVLMQNVGTAFAVKRAIIDGEPLTERVVTLTGNSLKQPQNVWGRIGTPISHLLHYAGFQPHDHQLVIMGGPLMGFTLTSLDVPMVKITNCLLAPSREEMGNPSPEQGCIRCSACADACPAGLLPQQLYWYCQGGDHEKARAYNINDCIECGACAYVCPSNIPLVQYYRQEKAELYAIDLEAQRTAEAKARFEARQARLDKEKAEREARHAAAKARVSRSDKQEVQAALARVKVKKSDSIQDIAAEPDSISDNQAVITQREARKNQAQQAKEARRSAVEAAVARAKAKKTELGDQEEAGSLTQDDFDSATQLNQTAVTAATSATPALPEIQSKDDPRKAAVAAAVARAKAKKQAQETAKVDTPSQPEVTNIDPRKAAVAAAVARAKAKKQAQETAKVDTPSQPELTNVDPRKAAVAAAVARAKAKKQALSETEPLNSSTLSATAESATAYSSQSEE